MQTIILTGRLCADPTLGNAGENEFARFRLAVDTHRKDNQGNYITAFYSCTGWRKFLSDRIARLSKGQLVCVTGTPEVSTYKDRTGEDRMALNVNVQTVESLSAPASGRGRYSSDAENLGLE